MEFNQNHSQHIKYYCYFMDCKSEKKLQLIFALKKPKSSIEIDYFVDSREEEDGFEMSFRMGKKHEGERERKFREEI